jgi:hypothetical protein
MLEISDTYNKRVKELNIEVDERRAELRADANDRILKLEIEVR